MVFHHQSDSSGPQNETVPAMKTTPVSRIIALCLLAPLAAPAQSGPREGRAERPSFEEIWGKYDVDGDGFLSFSEFNAMRRVALLPKEQRLRLFNRLDKDGDGRISRQELREIRQRRGGGRNARGGMRRLMELDTDGSGGVSLEEFRAAEMFTNLPAERVEALFHRLDTDGDGQITPKDRPELPPMLRGKRGPRSEPHRRIFDHLDADGTGKLSFEEFRSARGIAALDEDAQEKIFLRLDTDGDKQLSYKEFSEASLSEITLRGNRRRRSTSDD